VDVNFVSANSNIAEVEITKAIELEKKHCILEVIAR
jgi:hypothetical protein